MNGDNGPVYIGIEGTKDDAQAIVNSLYNNGITDSVEPNEIGERFFYTVLPNPQALVAWEQVKLEKKFDPERIETESWRNWIARKAQSLANAIPTETFIRFAAPEIAFLRFLVAGREGEE